MSLKINNAAYNALVRDGIAAQGDLLIVNINLCPMGKFKEEWEVVVSTDGRHTVAHSETGHHHQLRPYSPSPGVVLRAPTLWRDNKSPTPEMKSVVEVGEELAEIVHLRNHDTHETHILPAGTWVLLRQGRPTPEGWKVVAD